MKRLFYFFLILILATSVVSAQKNSTRENNGFTIPSSIDSNITPIKSKKKKKSLFKRKHGKKSFLMRMKPSYHVFMHYSQIHNDAMVDLQGDRVMLNENPIGNYSIKENKEYYQNDIQIGDYQNSWSTLSPPKQYKYTEYAPKRDLVVGFITELRNEKKSTGQPMKGYFLNFGLMYMSTPFPEISNVDNFQIHFPVGAGVIIPGDYRFHTEIGANALLSSRGVTGGKFDFLFVVKNIKFGPVFTFSHSTYNNIHTQFGSAGLQIGIIPNKQKSHKRRRR